MNFGCCSISQRPRKCVNERSEGESMSEKLEEFMRTYNDKHRIGNPQTRLDVMCGVKAEQYCYCGKKAEYETFSLEGRKFFLCESHFKQNRDARLLKKWKPI